MNNELRYSFYHFKKTLIRLALMVLYSLIVVNSEIHNSWSTNRAGQMYHSFSFSDFAINILILGFIVAILEFAEFKNRRNLDTWYSLPVDRWKIAVIHFINGAVQLFIAHTLSFIWGIICVAPFIKECSLNMGYMFAMYFAVLGLGLVFYGFTIFPFMVANNTLDGVIFAISYNIVPLVLVGFFESLTRSNYFSSYETGLIDITYDVAHVLCTNFYPGKGSADVLKSIDIVMLVVWVIIGLACLAMAIVLFDRKPAEKIGGTSDSILGYTLIIPITMILTVLMAGGTPIIGTLYGIVTFIGYIIFRRGIKLHIPDIVVITVVTILANIPVEYVHWMRKLIIGTAGIFH